MIFTDEDTTFFRNVDYQSHKDTASYPRRINPQKQRPENLKSCVCSASRSGPFTLVENAPRHSGSVSPTVPLGPSENRKISYPFRYSNA